MSLLVATTVAPYKFQTGPEETMSWLAHAEAWRERGHEFFLAMERGWAEPHDRWPDEAYGMVSVLEGVGGEIWQFKLDDREPSLTTGGRLVRICTGRNLCLERLNREPGRWEGVLFLDTDVEPPEDAPERLLEVDRPLVGFDVPTYGLDGPRVTPAGLFPDGADVREHWNTAGALLVREEPARRVRWRWDLATGQTDDPCFQRDAAAAGFGMTWVRHDVVGRHHPELIWPLERRGLDLTL